MSAGVDTTPDVDDLDLLDDTRRHARCVVCTGTRDELIGIPFIALCGRRAINLRRWGNPAAFPPDACEDCLALWGTGCDVHGAGA